MRTHQVAFFVFFTQLVHASEVIITPENSSNYGVSISATMIAPDIKKPCSGGARFNLAFPAEFDGALFKVANLIVHSPTNGSIELVVPIHDLKTKNEGFFCLAPNLISRATIMVSYGNPCDPGSPLRADLINFIK